MDGNLPHGPDQAGGPRVTNRDSAGGESPLPELQVSSRDLATLIEIDASRLDPNYKYRLVHKSRLKAARARAKGYVVVDPAQEDIFLQSGDQLEPAEDGTYTVADLFLMKIDIREHKRRRIAQRRKTEQRLSGPKKKFRSKARGLRDRAGAPIEVITTKEPGGSGRKGR